MKSPVNGVRDLSPGRRLVAATLALAGTAAACSGDDRRPVNVYAASSLTDVMDQVEERYEADHTDIDVRLNLAGSNALIRQINTGADAAVLVAADGALLDTLVDPPVYDPRPLAVNELALIVPFDNRASISGPADLGTAGVVTARCATGVPCGNATDLFLAATGTVLDRSTDEANVRSVLSKVASGEVDAGFVYRSDALTTGDVTLIPVLDPPRVTVTGAGLNDDPATLGLLDYLTSDEVAQVFAELGFVPVSE